jgi:hypothetical protein
MKKLSAIAMALALLLMSSPEAYPQARQTTTTPPPVASTLVREGDFATRLVSALEIGSAENEIEAETMLASAGIAPKNGWISDYPITPDILGELQDAVAAAADSNRLPMGKDEALEVLDSVSVDVGLYVLADTSGEYAETPPPASPQYTEPTVINNYYYREGPPVVTYYPPPPDYLYLYAWVPYPFWYARFSFSGFFILHDFHRVSIIHKRVVAVTNHVFHRQHRRFYKVDPVKRRGGRSFRTVARRTHGRPLFTAEARRGARSILQRSHGRMASQKRLVNRNVTILKSPKVFKGRTRTKIARQTRARSGLTGVRAKTSPRHNIQKVHRDSARSFTALGKNQGKPFRDPTARGRDSSKAARQIRAFNDRTGVRAKTFPRQEVQRAHRNPARFFRAPGTSKGRSSSLPPMGKRDFSGGLRKGSSKAFSGKVSRKIPGGSALKGALKLPF